MAVALSRSDTVIRTPLFEAPIARYHDANGFEPARTGYDHSSGSRRQNPVSGLKTAPATVVETPIRIRLHSTIAPLQAAEINSSHKMDNPAGAPPAGIDPISQHILERTGSSHRAPATHHAASPHANAAPSDDLGPLARQATGVTETDSLNRTDSVLSNRGTKEKRKGFLSRILGNKSKEASGDAFDSASEVTDNREAGTNAEVFSQPIGFVPKFPAPPRYIRVRPQNRKKRDFDRLFLAQILSEGALRSRKASEDCDAKIHAIDDRPVAPPPNSTRTKSNAVWAAEFSKDGQYFAAGGQDRKLKVWRVISSKEDRESAEDESGREIKLNAPVFKHELVREYEGHASAILDLSWSKNNFLLSSSMDKTVRLYHISRPECLCAFKHSDFVTSISFHPRDDRFFLAGSLDCKLRLWSIPDKNVAYAAQVHDMVTAVAFTPDGKTAIAGTLSGLCTLYDTDGLRAHSQIHVRSNRGKNSKGSKITGIDTISIPKQNAPPDVKILITSNDSRIRLYNLRDRSLEAKFRGNENATSQIRASFSDDGRFVICGSEDKRVYIWPVGPVERQDSDKRPVEIFEAHGAVVTTALLLPTKSRVLLARSGDPIYDLCNPPPVKLLSRTESVLSSGAPTETSDAGASQTAKPDSPPQAVEETPQYAARHSHHGGLILVTGDYTGEIKVFRQDCAYHKRKEHTWDNASFSRKMLTRSGSITTRTSERSSIYRKSLTFSDSRGPANRESIINWRNSVMSAKSASAVTSTSELDTNDNYRASSFQERNRSASPSGHGKRGLAHLFSLRHGSTPLAHSTRPSTDESQRLRTPETVRAEHQRLSDVTINGNGSPGYHSASESLRRGSSPIGAGEPTRSKTIAQRFAESAVPDISLTEASPELRNPINKAESYDNGLFLVGDQSYMAYDVKNNILPMIQAQPRTPGPNVLNREPSYVSDLSSGRSSATSYENNDKTGLGINGARVGRDGKSETEELKCKRCGNETFAMARHAGNSKGSGLKCRNCGQTVEG